MSTIMCGFGKCLAFATNPNVTCCEKTFCKTDHYYYHKLIVHGEKIARIDVFDEAIMENLK